MEDFEIIYAYSRADAIADGVLIEVTDLAKEAGFRYPVAMTSTAWHECVEVDQQLSNQDERGRLWDVLMVLRSAISRCKDTSVISFKVLVADESGKQTEKRLKAICGPGDNEEPVITIMLPDED